MTETGLISCDSAVGSHGHSSGIASDHNALYRNFELSQPSALAVPLGLKKHSRDFPNLRPFKCVP